MSASNAKATIAKTKKLIAKIKALEDCKALDRQWREETGGLDRQRNLKFSSTQDRFKIFETRGDEKTRELTECVMPFICNELTEDLSIRDLKTNTEIEKLFNEDVCVYTYKANKMLLSFGFRNSRSNEHFAEMWGLESMEHAQAPFAFTWNSWTALQEYEAKFPDAKVRVRSIPSEMFAELREKSQEAISSHEQVWKLIDIKSHVAEFAQWRVVMTYPGTDMLYDPDKDDCISEEEQRKRGSPKNAEKLRVQFASNKERPEVDKRYCNIMEALCGALCTPSPGGFDEPEWCGLELQKRLLALLITMRCIRVVDIINKYGPASQNSGLQKAWETRHTADRTLPKFLMDFLQLELLAQRHAVLEQKCMDALEEEPASLYKRAVQGLSGNKLLQALFQQFVQDEFQWSLEEERRLFINLQTEDHKAEYMGTRNDLPHCFLCLKGGTDDHLDSKEHTAKLKLYPTYRPSVLWNKREFGDNTAGTQAARHQQDEETSSASSNAAVDGAAAGAEFFKWHKKYWYCLLCNVKGKGSKLPKNWGTTEHELQEHERSADHQKKQESFNYGLEVYTLEEMKADSNFPEKLAAILQQ